MRIKVMKIDPVDIAVNEVVKLNGMKRKLLHCIDVKLTLFYMLTTFNNKKLTYHKATARARYVS